LFPRSGEIKTNAEWLFLQSIEERASIGVCMFETHGMASGLKF
jgi:hypothetical protein